MPVDPWASIRPFFPSATPAGLNTDDAARIMAYDVYDNMYWSNPDTYKIIPRSEDVNPIYLPCARSMIEATHRFLAVKWDFLVHPKVGTPEDQNTIKSLLQNLFKRELMYAKFSTQKRNGLIRGDAMWHITADPEKAPGERISIHELHPGEYFEIVDEDNSDRIIGCYIVDQTADPNDKTKVLSRRQMYRKQDNGTILSELALFELGKWDDRVKADDAKKVQDIMPAAQLPPQIKTLPVYHIKNFRTGTIWGASQIRGIETVMAAVNQSVSDQDLAISMQGLGVYWTNSGPPKGPNGEDGPFVMGPGEVVEVSPESTFGRVSGVSGSLPGIEHMKFMIDQASEAVGVPELARGRADVTVAESGIALYLQMAPLLAQNGEKEQEMLGIYDHMFYDLVKQWFPAYEGIQENLQVEVASVVGDPMPQNRDAQIAEILTLVTSVPPLITIEMAQAKLTALGYEFPEGAGDQVIQDAKNINEARSLSDPYASRFKEELQEGEEVA